jgi:hypothetical protein
MKVVFLPYMIAWILRVIAWVVDKEFFFFLCLYVSFSLAFASLGITVHSFPS